MLDTNNMLRGGRDIGQVIVNLQQEVAYIHKQVDETRKAIDEVLKGLFGVSKRAPTHSINDVLNKNVVRGLELINLNVMDTQPAAVVPGRVPSFETLSAPAQANRGMAPLKPLGGKAPLKPLGGQTPPGK